MSKVGRNQVDKAGGKIIGEQADSVFANGDVIAVKGDSIENHGKGNHANATMKECSDTVFACGKGICRKDDKATCDCKLAPGSNDVFADDN